MSTPVYYLKISAKILNKMTVCKPQRTGLMWAVEYLRSPSLNRFSHPSPFLCPPSSKGQCRTGKWEKEREQEEQRGTGVEEEEEEG